MKHIHNKVARPVVASAAYIPARKSVQVYVAGPVRCVAVVETEGGPVRVPLGSLDGPVEFQTRCDWTVQAEDGKAKDCFLVQPEDRVTVIRDEVSYTSLDMPRPISEIEKLMRMQQLQIDRLERAARNVPRNTGLGGFEGSVDVKPKADASEPEGDGGDAGTGGDVSPEDSPPAVS